MVDAAIRWNAAHQNWSNFLNNSPAVQFKVIRYEDLVTNPRREILDIGSFLGVSCRERKLTSDVFWGDIDVYDHLSSAKSDVNTNSIGKGERSLDRRDKLLIKEVVGTMSAKFDYEL